jgi:hypothetical protein
VVEFLSVAVDQLGESVRGGFVVALTDDRAEGDKVADGGYAARLDRLCRAGEDQCPPQVGGGGGLFASA